jgi:hypothetical protein
MCLSAQRFGPHPLADAVGFPSPRIAQRLHNGQSETADRCPLDRHRGLWIVVMNLDTKSMVIEGRDDDHGRGGVCDHVRDEFTDHEQGVAGDRVHALDRFKPALQRAARLARREIRIGEFEMHRPHGCHTASIPASGAG